MKKFISIIVSLSLSIVMAICLPLSVIASATKTITAEFTVTFYQTEARKIFNMVNEFRTSDTWVWNSDDTAKEAVSGLPALQYDYELEKAAMQRAVEIALLYGHTRPDGTGCFTAYSCMSAAENVAATSTFSVERMHSLFQEDDKPYSGQGHRRNMLFKSVTAFAVACVEYNGIYYWAEEFRSPIGNTAETPANDSDTVVSAVIAESLLNSYDFSLDKNEYSLKSGATMEAPRAEFNYESVTNWPYQKVEGLSAILDWQSSDPSVASVNDGVIKARKAGSATLTAMALSTPLSITVNVYGTIKGDLDADGEITDQDAIYLLFHTFFPEDYSVSQDVDFNKNGVIDDQDAVYLLFYTFFPEDYPI